MQYRVGKHKHNTFYWIFYLTQVRIKGQIENNCDNLVCVQQKMHYVCFLYPFSIEMPVARMPNAQIAAKDTCFANGDKWDALPDNFSIADTQ